MSTDLASLKEQLLNAEFRLPFRRYQSLALEAFENRAPDHQHRCYLVMPPGSGKTALGLEIIRRAGNPAVVFCPNTAVQQQWAREWKNFQPQSAPATTDPAEDARISFLTYQSLCNLNPEHEELDEVVVDLWQQSLQRERGISESDARREIDHLAESDSRQYRRDLSRYRRRARRMIARGDESERLLDLLHPNGKRLVERITGFPQCTIVLDECHHLLEMWGYLVQALVDVMGEQTLVTGLTATPPRDLNEREADLYKNLFGYADFEVPTPAVVKEGDLAPYQELGYLTQPLQAESDYIAEQHLRFEELITRLLDHQFASQPFLNWVDQRVHLRFSSQGALISWNRFERDNPELARAALKLCYRFDMSPPDGVRLREPHRQPMTADDWVMLIEDYAVNALRLSERSEDHAAWESIREALPTLGYVLTSNGIRRHVSPVDRVLAHSASKGVAAGEILEVEASELGSDLRALVLCDYERTSSEMVARLRGVLDDQAGSAILLLETFLASGNASRLNPLLMTAQTVACSRETGEWFRTWLTEREPDLGNRLELLSEGPSDGVVSLQAPGGGWTSRNYVPLITEFFESGYCQCLIGTRGLLGEGWDARRVNVLIDLTTASTATAVHQMRGRSIRLDPAWDEKVANNWDVVCIDPEHPRGTADYDRFVRKHRSYFAPNREGEIESGVSHVHHALSPFGPPELVEMREINSHSLRRATERRMVREQWRIGEPYENHEVGTIRIRPNRSLGVPNQQIFRANDPENERGTILRRAGVTGAATAATAAGIGLMGLDPVTLLAPVMVAGGGTWWTARSFQYSISSLGPSDNLEDFGRAILEAMREIGELPDSVRESDLRVVIQEDGYYRCYIAGVDEASSQIFATSLDELLAPLSTPRYLIPRYVAEPPNDTVAALRIAVQYLSSGRTGSSVVYHTVPDVLARNRERVAAFENAWQRHVSDGRALFYRDEEAQAILQTQIGEDLFDVTTQMRTLWR
jgi:superfamily II DNA or RNA helicase